MFKSLASANQDGTGADTNRLNPSSSTWAKEAMEAEEQSKDHGSEDNGSKAIDETLQTKVKTTGKRAIIPKDPSKYPGNH